MQPNKLRIEVMESLDSTRSSVALMDAMRVLKAPRSDATDVARALSFDPTLAESIVTEVNSPYFGIPNKVEKLDQAITLLGFDRVGELLQKTVSHEMYEQAAASYFEMSSFQKHGVAVGCLSEQLARALKLENPEDFYAAGSMHDIGKYMYLTRLSEQFRKLIKEVRETMTPMYLVERRILGTDHAELGELMADAWGLPDHVRVAIRYHHDCSDKERERLTTRETQVVDLVSYANLLSHGTKYGGLSWGAKLQYDDSRSPPGILSEQDVRMVVKLAENQYNDAVKVMGLE